jgi:hypothetical protein
MKRIVSLLVLLLLAFMVVNLSGCRKTSRTVESPQPNDTTQEPSVLAGNWRLPILLNAGSNGLKDVVELREVLRDPKIKFVLIHYWATWGEPANIAMVDLNEIFANYKDKGLMVFGITIDNKLELRDDIIKTIEGMKDRKDGKPVKITYPILWDVLSISKDIYGVTTIPLTLIVDKNNTIFYQQSGFSEELNNELLNKLKELMP